jgi:nucleoside-diphosphate-sugar epimerase
LNGYLKAHLYNLFMRSFLGALPARFRKPSLLIIGCGDIGLRTARLLHGRFRIIALTSSPDRLPQLRAAGIRPLIGNLDDRATLVRLGCHAQHLLHLAPPQSAGAADLRTFNLLNALRSQRVGIVASGPGRCHAVYASTTGVYGDWAGQHIDETAVLRAATSRALRRVDAERQLRAAGATGAFRVSILRVPGIYDSGARSPRERLLKRTPVLAHADDVFTNHIHADDLARACVLALARGRVQRVYNINDDTQLRMGEYFDIAADAMQLLRPPRISRAEAEQTLSPMQMSFMSESRRLDNARMKRELRLKLRYADVSAAFTRPAA